ncbi:sensor histidine kinase YehU [Kordia sp. SMS9]|uniref:sensor histidine kinase n=1 Tax=Kordia sp. SMS9 TaxID=2282170 RepID=UPI000E0D8CE6|nr:histidine kinase [Kordia sp. SMS9]AXG70655.1 sensor histidine kinase YehU [Kordia sp. SMS9]
MNVKLNRSDYMLLVIYYGVSVLMAIYEYANRKHELIEFFLDIPSFVIVDILIIYLFLYWLLPSYILKNKKYFQFTFWTLLVLILAGFWEDVIGHYSGGHDWGKFEYGFQQVLNYISDSAQSIGLPFGLLLAKKYYENQILFGNIKEKQKENELKLLRSQISPHFLFNNLNTLDALIDSDTEKAKEYLNRLSLIYRYLIQTKDAEVMELSEELELAENYIFLIKTRFGDDYDFTITKNVSIENKFVPTGAIQTLLENIAKHNRSQHGKVIKAKIVIDADWLTVQNTKSILKPNENSLGTGLKNLEYRYQLLSDQKPEITDTIEKFVVKIPIIKLSEES